MQTIKIRVDQGVVSVENLPENCEVVVRDYDTEGASEDDFVQDSEGEDCFYQKWVKGADGDITWTR